MAKQGESADRKRLFSKELRCMMYGFGDDQNPYTESVDFIEDLVIEYITEVVSLKNQIKSILLQLKNIAWFYLLNVVFLMNRHKKQWK